MPSALARALDFAAGDRRATMPPTTHKTRQRASSESPNQTAGEKMIFDAQLPIATMPFHSSRSNPLK